MTRKWIVGAGAALVDLLVEESDQFLANQGAKKGGMTLVEISQIESALSKTKSKVVSVPGGSACNTLVGIGNLGGSAHMIGRMGKDSFAEQFLAGLKKSGVESSLASTQTPTGRVLSMVTPDAQRTMFTYLGAAAELSPEDIDTADLAKAFIIHLEGYLLFNRPVVEKILQIKKNTRAKLALDLASFEVVEACRPFIDEIMAEQVDIIIANEDEAKAYTGETEENALAILSKNAEVAVVKLGKAGALISHQGEITRVKAEAVKALDTTGAGDLWAAGFFYGLACGYPMEKCGLIAARVAAEVVQVMGASISEEGWNRIRGYIQSLD